MRIIVVRFAHVSSIKTFSKHGDGRLSHTASVVKIQSAFSEKPINLNGAILKNETAKYTKLCGLMLCRYLHTTFELEHDFTVMVNRSCFNKSNPKALIPWHSTDCYRRTIWQCNSKFEKKCKTPVLTTEAVQSMFITAYNRVMQNLQQVLADCKLMRISLKDFDALDVKITSQAEEAEVIAEMVKAAVTENAFTAQSQQEYLKKYNSLNKRYEDAVAMLEKLKAERTLREQQDRAMGLFIQTLKKQPQILEEWNDTIWTVMVEKGIVYPDGHIKFVFYNGTEIEVGAE